jgi:hypothetical protein
MEFLLERSLASRRRTRPMNEAPALAKDRAIWAPMPVLTPVMTMALPFPESSGRDGEMEGVGVEF